MKFKCYITPSQLFMSGHAQRVLDELGSGPYSLDKNGRIVCQLTEAQITMWALKAAQHHIEVVRPEQP